MSNTSIRILKTAGLLACTSLIAVGVSQATADQDAEGVEHHVSEETLSAFREFLKEREPGA